MCSYLFLIGEDNVLHNLLTQLCKLYVHMYITPPLSLCKSIPKHLLSHIDTLKVPHTKEVFPLLLCRFFPSPSSGPIWVQLYVLCSQVLANVAVPGRNQTLFHCTFQSHRHVRSAVTQYFCYRQDSYTLYEYLTCLHSAY